MNNKENHEDDETALTNYENNTCNIMKMIMDVTGNDETMKITKTDDNCMQIDEKL